MPLANKELQIKRVYEEPKRSDGARILVDRLWPRGLSKADAHLTDWFKDIAPSPELRKWFGHGPARWEEFQRRYTAELSDKEQALAALAGYLHKGTVTLLYGAKDVVHNHAVVLAKYMRNHRGR